MFRICHKYFLEIQMGRIKNCLPFKIPKVFRLYFILIVLNVFFLSISAVAQNKKDSIPEKNNPNKYYYQEPSLTNHHAQNQRIPEQVSGNYIDIEGLEGYEFTRAYLGQNRLNEPYLGANFRYAFATKGLKRCNLLYGYPHIGIGAQFDHAISKGQFGSFSAAYGFITIPMTRTKKFPSVFELDYRISIGLAYDFFSSKSPNIPLATAYSPINVFSGSSLNLYTCFSLDANVRLNPYWGWQIGFDASHFSNGDLQDPNFGANLLGLHLALRYYLKPYIEPIRDQGLFPQRNLINHDDNSEESPVFKPQSHLYILSGSGVKQANSNGPNFFKQNVQIGFARRWSEKYQLDVGIDLFYSTPTMGGYAITEPPANYYYQGVFLTHEAIIGRFAFIMGLGVYVHNKFINHTLEYNRLGIKYYLGKRQNFFAGFNIKAHVQHADNYEFILGSQFNL